MSPSAPSVNRFFINPRYSIFYRRAKSFVQTEQVQTEHGILFVLGGKLQYEAEEEHREIVAGQTLLVGTSQRFTASGKDVDSLFLIISSQLLLDYAVRMRLIGPAGNVSFPTTRLDKENSLASFGRSLTRELVSEDSGSEIVIGAVVEQIVVHLLRKFCNMRRSDELELSRVGLIDRRIRRAVELMHSQLDHELSLKEIAAASYLSPFHFSRLFKKLTGTTPHAYLGSLRTKQAQLLLAESDLSITEISARVGYSSSSHFTQAFRQSTGLTPRAFRKALITHQPR